MKFKPTVNIWEAPEEACKHLQPGQWVSAGKPDPRRDNCGVFCGVKPSGAVVVAWNGNVRQARSPKAYRKALMDYAKGDSRGY